LQCNDSSDGNCVQFDYFVVRLRIGFGGTDQIDVIADRLPRPSRDAAPIHIKSD